MARRETRCLRPPSFASPGPDSCSDRVSWLSPDGGLRNNPPMLRLTALLLTVLTGFSGLAYEITWQKYLATLLGAHSEATASVLAIFLGGLSLGYWIFGILTRRLVDRAERGGPPARLLRFYGIVEGSIGVYCLLFPHLFRGARAFSVALPGGTGGIAFIADVLLCALLIGPPVVLMGGTIPILTQGLSRSLADATRFHALVYAFNTVGAFLGALLSGFVLIPWLGLDGVMRAMALLNLGAGALFIVLGTRSVGTPPVPAPSGESDPGRAASPVYAIAALLVGFAMMALQTILIRMGGLSLGASEYTFSMVVAVFVLCIALGSFLVSALPRIGKALLPLNLWGLGLLFIVFYPWLEQAPFWAHVLRTAFRDHDQVFYVYQTAIFFSLLLALGPAVVLSGATLPLLFHAIRREVGDLGGAAGRLYSLNTVGSLLGALLGGYVLLFWLDLHHVYRIALVAVGLAAAVVTARLYPRSGVMGAGALLLALVVTAGSFEAWRPDFLAAGLFRHRKPEGGTQEGPDAVVAQNWDFHFYDDGPASSVAVVKSGDTFSIVVNGKPDSNTHGDRFTMRLAALFPALFAERAERSFVIGYGTGMTAGQLAALDEMEQVTVAEISRAVVDAAPHFDFANGNASQHPKIEVVASDAYRALLQSEDRYDVIVSEPSNPWVAGVEMLFSREFLEVARDQLTPGGVYAQWIHLYANDTETLSLVLRTYAEVFEHVAVWETQSVDVLLMGFRDASNALDLERLEQRAARPDFRAGMRRLGITSFAALLAHESLPLGVVHALGFEGPLHTLYHPRLSFQAGRAFFRGETAGLPFSGWGEAAQVGTRNSLLRRYLDREGELPEATWHELVSHACGEVALTSCGALLANWVQRTPTPEKARRLAQQRGLQLPWLHYFATGEGRITEKTVTPRPALSATNLYQFAYLHALPFRSDSLLRLWKRCRTDSLAPEACRAGLRLAQSVLAGRMPTAIPAPLRPVALQRGGRARVPPAGD